MCAVPAVDIRNHLCGKRAGLSAAVGGRHGAAVCSGRHGLAKTNAVKFPNPVKEKLARGEVSIGSWLNLASPLAAEVLAEAGYEWLAIDTEHTAWDLAEITHAVRAIEARGAVPMARAWSHEPEGLGRILDTGVMGLIVPHVSTVEQAEAIADAVRYAPRGHRSGGNSRAAISGDYVSQIDDNLLVCPQIEDCEGVDNIAEIMAVDGMDVAFIGPNDLVVALGYTRADVYRVPEHLEAMARILAGAQANGKPAGTPAPTAAHARQLIAQGFTFVDLSSDLRLLAQVASQELQAVRA